MLDIKRVLASAPGKPISTELQPLNTPWSEAARKGEPLTEHPHPQFKRERFHPLNGSWDYSIIPSDQADTAWRSAPIPSSWDGTILVPFSPEAPLSGVGRQLKPNELLWYRRSFGYPSGTITTGDRCMLHFEAVDYACACYCNGILVGTHVGGYLPFAFDITDALDPNENEIALCVYDPSDKGVQLRGKQKLERGGIWYTAQSGIWQSVWLEIVPEDRITSLNIEADPDSGTLSLMVTIHEQQPGGTPLSAALIDNEEIIRTSSSETPCRSTANSEAETASHTITFSVDKPHLWSPDDPHLYDIELTFGRDKVASYCAFRSVSVKADDQGVCRFHLNHEPYFLKGILDQGYWPDGLMTAASDDALIFDIQEMKSLGFNMLRKHIKIESDRWYYHCDRLGMLVIQDMVSGGAPPHHWYTSYKPTFFRHSWGHYTDGAAHYRALSSESEAYRTEWTETCTKTISYLGNHPSIITWGLFNEAWGQFDAASATDRVRSLDPSRPIDAVSGWYDQRCGDFLSVHNYFRPLEVYQDEARPQRAFIISEFGGLSYHLPEHSSLPSSYGYESYSDAASYRNAVHTTLAQACALEQEGLAGFIYTQLSDVEEETNGILTYDRRCNKFEDKDLF